MSGIIAQNTLDNSGLIKAPAGGGAWNFIKKLTASASSDLSFVDGTSDVVLDSTYKEYIFTFNNIHSDRAFDVAYSLDFQFNMSIDSGSNYNVTKTTTMFRSQHSEAGGDESFAYQSDRDLAQSTAFQTLAQYVGTESDNSSSGYLHLFNPSSTTFVKHFICTLSCVYSNTFIREYFIAGYGNTTSAVDAVQFKFSADEIDAGDICLYGISS
jgi:hypothetical protein